MKLHLHKGLFNNHDKFDKTHDCSWKNTTGCDRLSPGAFYMSRCCSKNSFRITHSAACKHHPMHKSILLLTCFILVCWWNLFFLKAFLTTVTNLIKIVRWKRFYNDCLAMEAQWENTQHIFLRLRVQIPLLTLGVRRGLKSFYSFV